ncbi:hypothetical protein [Saccharothrix coeruleofusca]|uniref:Uncharacterized protein n=1 Tax=Saccharothrix coeruleofusca TaxID=33919 RepID=A0A918AHS9_9PSEU|nr:hypothetical protein [Saccharothrix coeruleofusca]GGP41773.1 hypothetical protein GCM10010185_11280 [Saccharothrix coeruleofusca]
MSPRLLLPVVLVVAAASVGVGLLARDLYHRPAVAKADQIAVPSSAPSSVPRSAQPGDSTVRLSVDAAQHPDGARVRTVLQEFFDAINAHDYDRWSRTVTAERSTTTPRSLWMSDYESTRDGTILVHRVESAADGRLRVLMTFTSVQDIAKAPVGMQSDCIRWRVVYPLKEEGGELRVDSVGVNGSSSQLQPC